MDKKTLLKKIRSFPYKKTFKKHWRAIVGIPTALLILLGVYVIYEVRFGDTSYLSREKILERIARESVLYYNDGTTQLGGFFKSGHRKYINFASFPQYLVHAIVASEDKDFFSHRGIDFTATLKAVGESVLSFRLKRGASTITQQTVKIVFDQWERSLTRKFREAISALKMEKLYTKEEILEFYLNQFHVTGNGFGSGIAAKYYFNKEISELGLVECAFIAGSVKNPGRYNPFNKTTQKDKEKARKAANDRKNYVIKRMRDEGYLTEEEYQAGVKTPIPFQKGDFQSQETSVKEFVKQQLNSPEIMGALGFDDLSDLEGAGLHIVTNLDKSIQDTATRSLRRGLSLVDLTLRGFQPETQGKYYFQKEINVGETYVARVEHIEKSAVQPQVTVSFGEPKGTAGREALYESAEALAKASGESVEKALGSFLSQIKVGQFVLVEVLEFDQNTQQAKIAIRQRPAINGGFVVSEAGKIKALIPGYESTGYNRVVAAMRQPGSTFKLLVYLAALQTGWHITDLLNNDRQLFVYQNQFYFPRSAHETKHFETSMLWTCAQSENLASVFLTYFLTEKLSKDDFYELLNIIGLGPNKGEGKSEYLRRVQASLRVYLSDDGYVDQQIKILREELYEQLKRENDYASAKIVRGLWSGKNFEQEMAKVLAQKPKDISPNEINTRVQLLKNNLVILKKSYVQLHDDWNTAKSIVVKGSTLSSQDDQRFRDIAKNFYWVTIKGNTKELAYAVQESERILKTGFETLRKEDLFDILSEAPISGAHPFKEHQNVENVRLHGFITSGYLQHFMQEIEFRVQKVREGSDSHDRDKFFAHHDVKVAVGLRYLNHLGKKLGVNSPIDEVMSFALGTNSVTLAEVAKIYQTILTGKIYKFKNDGLDNQLAIIDRITDSQGQVLYQAEIAEKKVLSDPLKAQLLEMLNKTVEFGTARVLYNSLRIAGTHQRIPVFGKTGTTNDYTSGFFAGQLVLPQVQPVWDLQTSFTIATYAGFDNNASMRKGLFKGYGGSTALRSWNFFARDILAEDPQGPILNQYVQNLQKQPESLGQKRGFVPLAEEVSGIERMPVDLVTGQIASAEGSTPAEISAEDLGGVNIDSEQDFNSIIANTQIWVDRGFGQWKLHRDFSPLR